MFKCFSCGKEIGREDGTNVAGLRIHVSTRGRTPERGELLNLSLGKYAPSGSKNFVADFCYECVIDSLMGTFWVKGECGSWSKNIDDNIEYLNT